MGSQTTGCASQTSQRKEEGARGRDAAKDRLENGAKKNLKKKADTYKLLWWRGAPTLHMPTCPQLSGRRIGPRRYGAKRFFWWWWGVPFRLSLNLKLYILCVLGSCVTPTPLCSSH